MITINHIDNAYLASSSDNQKFLALLPRSFGFNNIFRWADQPVERSAYRLADSAKRVAVEETEFENALFS